MEVSDWTPSMGCEDGFHKEGQVGSQWSQDTGPNWINLCWRGVKREHAHSPNLCSIEQT